MKPDRLLWDFYTIHGQSVKFRRDEVIIALHSYSEGAYFLQSGFIKAYDITKYGQSNLLMIYKAGEIFPLPWMIREKTDDEINLVFEALTNVNVLKVSKSEILSKIRADPEFAQVVVERILDIFNIYSYRIQNLGLRSARARVTFRLLLMAERFGINRDGDILIDAPITHQLIADSTALTRETTSREMRALAREGYIEQQGHLVVIKNHEKMASEFE